jgi:putative NIF3 family GTP cyclohydrolase 1 type 2
MIKGKHMKIEEIFELAIQMGINSDIRGKEGVQKFLDKKRKKYESLNGEAKEEFDTEELYNPYLDSRIYNISKDKEIKKILAGIDIDTSELLLAKEIGGIDLVIAHHPVGRGLATLSDIMDLQKDMFNYYGVPINVAEGLMSTRISEVSRGTNPSNHNKTVDAAKILGINFLNIHGPADNLVSNYIKILIEKESFDTVDDVINFLKKIPEYKEAGKIGVGPKIFVGRGENRCGKIAVMMTGGTGGSSKLIEKLVQAGVGTLIDMHISEDHKKEAEANNLNIIIAGHISSDSLGMNLFLDQLEKRGIEVVCSSGLTRFKRI